MGVFKSLPVSDEKRKVTLIARNRSVYYSLVVQPEGKIVTKQGGTLKFGLSEVYQYLTKKRKGHGNSTERE